MHISYTENIWGRYRHAETNGQGCIKLVSKGMYLCVIVNYNGVWDIYSYCLGCQAIIDYGGCLKMSNIMNKNKKHCLNNLCCSCVVYAMVDISISHSSSKSCRSLVLKLGWLSHIDSITNPSLLLLQLCKPCVDISDDFDWYSDLYISIKCFARSTRQAKQSEMKVCWWRSIRWTLHLRKFSNEQVAYNGSVSAKFWPFNCTRRWYVSCSWFTKFSILISCVCYAIHRNN